MGLGWFRDSFLGALQFLTIVPIRARTADLGSSALFFPLVGAALGLAGAAILESLRAYLPFTLLALIVLTFWASLTGGLHEDGIADVADAFRSGRSPDKIFAILKDSRIGAHGALALIFITLIRWQALSSIAVDTWRPLAASLAVSRASVIAVIWVTPPAGSGLAAELSRTLTTPIAVAVILQAVVLACWCGPLSACALLGGATAIVLLARRYFMRRIGGVNGDCLGAAGLVVETFCLVVFTCRLFIW